MKTNWSGAAHGGGDNNLRARAQRDGLHVEREASNHKSCTDVCKLSEFLDHGVDLITGGKLSDCPNQTNDRDIVLEATNSKKRGE